jgi:hypothetical protein
MVHVPDALTQPVVSDDVVSVLAEIARKLVLGWRSPMCRDYLLQSKGAFKFHEVIGAGTKVIIQVIGLKTFFARFCPLEPKRYLKPPATGKRGAKHQDSFPQLTGFHTHIQRECAGRKTQNNQVDASRSGRQPWRFHLGMVIIIHGVDDARNPFCRTKRLCSCR